MSASTSPVPGSASQLSPTMSVAASDNTSTAVPPASNLTCPSGAELLRHYSECCRVFKVRKANSGLLKALVQKTRHDEGIFEPMDRPRRGSNVRRRSQPMVASQEPSTGTLDGSGGAPPSAQSTGAFLARSGGQEDSPPGVQPLGLPPRPPQPPATGNSRYSSRGTSPASQPLNEIDLSRNYVGPRGLLSVFALCGRVTTLRTLNLTHSRWFACDKRPTAPSGEAVLKAMCQMLQGHPSLNVLILDQNEFTTSSYLCLLGFIYNSPNLRFVSVEDTFLDDAQKQHLASAVAMNVKRTSAMSPPPPLGASVLEAAAESEANESNTVTPKGSLSTPTAAHPHRREPTPRSVKIAMANANSRHKVKDATAIFSTMLHHAHDHPSALKAAERGLDVNVTSEALLTFMTQRVPLKPVVLGTQQPKSANPSNLPKRIDINMKPKSEEDVAEIKRAARLNGILTQLDDAEFEKKIIPSMRLAVFDKDDVIIETGDVADYVYLLTSGGAISVRSEELTMEHPVGSVLGEEELLSSHGNELRRFPYRACPDLVSPFAQERENQRPSTGSLNIPTAPQDDWVRTWAIPRDVFIEEIAKVVKPHRRHWTKYIDLLPALHGLGTMSRLTLIDCFRTEVFGLHEVICAGANMYDSMFFVMDGLVSIYFQGSEIKRLIRGDLFMCDTSTDVMRVSVVAAEKRVVLARVNANRFVTMPVHVQKHIMKQSKQFSMMEDGVLPPINFLMRKE